jgi:1,4-dihydroxy-2-naphthoyl-CoA hydrolase
MHSPTPKFDYLRRIYLSDTDAAGVIYFARGLEICHQAYEESLNQQGISLKQMIQEGKTALPIVHAEIDFLRPLVCGDQIQVNLVASLINQSEFAIAYQIFLVDNLEQILVKAQTRHVCINPQIRQRVDLPVAVLDWLTV